MLATMLPLLASAVPAAMREETGGRSKRRRASGGGAREGGRGAAKAPSGPPTAAPSGQIRSFPCMYRLDGTFWRTAIHVTVVDILGRDPNRAPTECVDCCVRKSAWAFIWSRRLGCNPPLGCVRLPLEMSGGLPAVDACKRLVVEDSPTLFSAANFGGKKLWGKKNKK